MLILWTRNHQLSQMSHSHWTGSVLFHDSFKYIACTHISGIVLKRLLYKKTGIKKETPSSKTANERCCRQAPQAWAAACRGTGPVAWPSGGPSWCLQGHWEGPQGNRRGGGGLAGKLVLYKATYFLYPIPTLSQLSIVIWCGSMVCARIRLARNGYEAL